MQNLSASLIYWIWIWEAFSCSNALYWVLKPIIVKLVCPYIHQFCNAMPFLSHISSDHETGTFKRKIAFWAEHTNIVPFSFEEKWDYILQLQFPGAEYICLDTACRYWPWLRRLDPELAVKQKPLLSVMHSKAHQFKCQVCCIRHV